MLRTKLSIAITLTLPLVIPMLLEIFGIHLMLPSYLQFILASIVQFYCGYSFYSIAFKGLRYANLSMDTLVVMGTTAAWGFSTYATFFANTLEHALYYESSALIITLILLGRYLEARSKSKVANAISYLFQLIPKTVSIEKDSQIIKIAAKDIQKDDIVLVGSGENIPIDGIIIEGSAHINEVMITGESLPIYKQEQDNVIGGTLNTDGFLKIKATAVGNSTVLAQIIDLVETAQMSKAPIQKLADKIAGVFVPVVIGLAILVFLVWSLIGDMSLGIIAAIAVLIIACPCALGLATPTALMMGTSLGAKHGILIKNSQTFEKARSVSVIVFDKTGTLTEGKPLVKAIKLREVRVGEINLIDRELKEINHANLSNTFISTNSYVADAEVAVMDEPKFLEIVASCLQFSKHPLAQAVCKYANEQQISLTPLKSFNNYLGLGIRAVLEIDTKELGNNEGKENMVKETWLGVEVISGDKEKIKEEITFLLGNEKLLKEHNIIVSTAYQTPTIATQTIYPSVSGITSGIVTATTTASLGKSENAFTVVHMATLTPKKEYLGSIFLGDTLKSSAKKTITELKSMQIKSIIFSGDNNAVVAEVAKALEIDEHYGSYSPQDKQRGVTKLQQQGAVVLMVGDGINDAPALAQANVSVAMSSGINVALETAEVIIMSQSLHMLPAFIALSKLTFRKIQQNLFWAFIYNIIAIPFAAMGLLNPVIAGFAMALSSVSVILNSLSLQRVKL